MKDKQVRVVCGNGLTQLLEGAGIPQDYTLINLLRHDPLPVWTLKADWTASLRG
jgi:hypothetical protein